MRARRNLTPTVGASSGRVADCRGTDARRVASRRTARAPRSCPTPTCLLCRPIGCSLEAVSWTPPRAACSSCRWVPLASSPRARRSRAAAHSGSPSPQRRPLVRHDGREQDRHTAAALGLPADCAAPKPVARSKGVRAFAGLNGARAGRAQHAHLARRHLGSLEFDGRSKTQRWVLTPLCDRRSEVCRRHWGPQSGCSEALFRLRRGSAPKTPSLMGRIRLDCHLKRGDQRFHCPDADWGGPART